MIKPIAAAGILILALMIAVKDHRVLRMAGLVGGCSPVQTASDGSQLQACGSGRLEGFPDLSSRGCSYLRRTAATEYWSCPAAVVTSPAR